MSATAIYNDSYAGRVEVRLVPLRSDKTRFFWLRDNGQVVGGQARALPAQRCINYAKAHRCFSNVEAV